MTFDFNKLVTIGFDKWKTAPFRFYGEKEPFFIGNKIEQKWQDIILHGNTALTLVNAKADSLEYLKLFGGTELLPETYLDTVTLSGGCEQRNLPSGYTQVEYLEIATSGAYFSTGINATVDTDMGITASNITSDSAQLLVAQCTSGSDYFRIAKAGASKKVIGSLGSSTVTDNNTTGVNKFTARMNKSGFYVNGSLVGTFSNIPSSLTNIGNIDIFRGKYSGIVYYAYVGSRFYGTFVDDNIFLPCRRNSDNQLGIYNTKTGQFILPSGTGTFTAGADAVPTPDNPMDIVCNNGGIKVSPNLLDVNNIEGNFLLTDLGKIGNNNSDWFTTNFIKVTPNTGYCFDFISGSDTQFRRICGYSSNNYNSFTELLVKKAKPTDVGTRYTETFTTSATTNYIKLSSCVDDMNSQIVEGSTATPYMPYGQIYIDGTQEVVTDSLGNTASAEMLLAVDTYKDTQEVLNGSVTRRIGITVLDGTETWTKSSTYTGSFYVNDYNPLDGAKVANNPNVYCTHGFKVDSLSEYSSASTGAIYWYAQGTINYKYDDGTATVAQFKQWLADQYNAGTPVTIAYPLATATTETVTGQFLSKSPVTQTAGSISNLPIAITESEKTTPTPQQPLDINCNNGAIKVSKNLFNGQFDTGWGISSSTGAITRTAGRKSFYIKVDPTKTYTISRSAVGSSTYFYYGTYVQQPYSDYQQCVSFGNIGTNALTGTITVPTEANYLAFFFGTGESPNVQVELGSTATTYMPYGQIYADGTTEMVGITGKNLFDTTGQTLNKYIDISGNEQDGVYPNYSFAHTDYIKVQPNTTYTFAITSVVSVLTNHRIMGWTADKTFIQQEANLPTASGGGVGTRFNTTFTTGATTEYITINYVYNPNGEQPQLELGSTATTYEPYTLLGTATVENLFKVGDYQDVQSVLDGGVTRNVGIKVFDGTENWVQGGVYNQFYTDVTITDRLLNQPAYCTHYTYTTTATDLSTKDNAMVLGSSSQRINFSKGSFENLTQFKQFLADQYANGTPIIIVYSLATPTTETVTPQPMNIQAGTNTVTITQASMDNLELEVKYKAGVSVTITEIQNAQLDDNVEVIING